MRVCYRAHASFCWDCLGESCTICRRQGLLEGDADEGLVSGRRGELAAEHRRALTLGSVSGAPRLRPPRRGRAGSSPGHLGPRQPLAPRGVGFLERARWAFRR